MHKRHVVFALFLFRIEPVFVNVFGAQESIPPGWESILGSLKDLIRGMAGLFQN
jgi:hypothetical protein